MRLARAWRVGLRREQDLPPVRPGEVTPKPDVRHTRRWCGMNTEVRTARRSQFSEIAQTPARKQPVPGEHACGVCASPETTRIFFEDHGGPDYSWRIWEVRCAECGCYSLYWIDD